MLTDSLRALRRRLLTPDIAETRLDRRGFHAKNGAVRQLLETVGESFLTGYGHAVQARCSAEAEEHLEEVPAQFRGFAYEGAAMGCAVLDTLLPGVRRTEELLRGRGRDHVYMAFVGIGWAMARFPRLCRPAVLRRDPLLSWLALDGYGFHQAYFHTDSYVHRQRRDTGPWWPGGCRGYVRRAVDQGVGRALWFVGGADPEHVAALVDRFPASRRGDLYGGVGLAATYAGGADEEELRALLKAAGEHRPQVAQGSAFAAEARARAGLVTPQTGLATRVLCGAAPEQAARAAVETRPADPDDGPVPAYETWRARLAEALTATGGP